MCDLTVVRVQRLLRHGQTQRGTADKLDLPEQTVRRIAAGQYKPLRPQLYVRCEHCGAMIKAGRPCLAAQLQGAA
jgi:hypothetical protein